MATKKTTTSSSSTNYDLSIFNVEVKPELLAQAIYIYQANSHNQAAKVKTRGEINRTHHKVYKQKHTGNARHGARSANVFVGGGVVFGPTGVLPSPKKLNQKMRLLSLVGILSKYQKENRLKITDLIQTDHSTKSALKSLSISSKDKSITLVHHEDNPKFLKSVQNIEPLKLATASRLNILDIASSKQLLITPNAYQLLVTRLKSVL